MIKLKNILFVIAFLSFGYSQELFEFNQLQIEKIRYEEYVIFNDGDCISDHCYKKYKDLENGGERLVSVEGRN